jgi:hypothetical protein
MNEAMKRAGIRRLGREPGRLAVFLRALAGDHSAPGAAALEMAAASIAGFEVSAMFNGDYEPATARAEQAVGAWIDNHAASIDPLDGFTVEQAEQLAAELTEKYGAIDVAAAPHRPRARRPAPPRSCIRR